MATALIQLDHFPAIAATPTGGRYEPARVVMHDGLVRVWHASGTTGPHVVYEAQALSLEGNRLAGFVIQTPDGPVRANTAPGCGCGNALKSFDPYNGATRRVDRS